MIFFAGDVLAAVDLNSIFPQTYVKNTTENRNTTITVADDAELAGIPLSVGTWDVEMLLFWFTNVITTTNPGFKTQWGFTGTWNASIRQCLGPGSSNVAGSTVVTPMNARGQTLIADAPYQAGSGGSYFSSRETCRNVVVTAAGNLSLKWAQAASTANPTSVAGLSTVTVRRIA